MSNIPEKTPAKATEQVRVQDLEGIAYDFSRERLVRNLTRLFETLNFDWFADKLPGVKPEHMDHWGDIVIDYDMYCIAKTQGRDILAESRDGSMKDLVHNVICLFTVIVFRPELIAKVADAVDKNESIDHFVNEKAQACGLTYPGGNGRTSERLAAERFKVAASRSG